MANLSTLKQREGLYVQWDGELVSVLTSFVFWTVEVN
jgi:hypothetical protein